MGLCHPVGAPAPEVGGLFLMAEAGVQSLCLCECVVFVCVCVGVYVWVCAFRGSFLLNCHD